MLVDEVARAVVEVFHVGDIGQRIPGMLDSVQALRIEPLPPQSFPVGFREMAVIGNASQWSGFVRIVRGLEPPPVARLVHGDPEAKPLFARRRGPSANYVTMRTVRCGIPWMVF